jgi:N4-gp56 family major capsid protein
MAFGSHTTTSAGLTGLIVTYYEKVGLERLLPKLRFYQFADKKPLPSKSGKTIQWYRFRQQSAVTTNMSEDTVPTQVYLSADTISATIVQRGAYAGISDMLTMTAIDPILEDAATLMGEKGARTVDTFIRDTLGFMVADHATRSSLTANRIAQMASTGITARVWTVDGSSTTGDGFPMLQNNTRVAQSSTVVSLTTSALTVKNAQHAAAYLRNRDVDPFDDGYYVGIINPINAYDLMTSGGWKGWQQYTSPEMMYKGEIGKVGGVRFVESSDAPAYSLSGDTLDTASGTMYGTLIFGKHAYGVTEISGKNTGNRRKGFEMFIKPVGSAGTADPVNQTSTVGFKMTMAAKILNKSAGVWVISNSTS